MEHTSSDVVPNSSSEITPATTIDILEDIVVVAVLFWIKKHRYLMSCVGDDAVWLVV